MQLEASRIKSQVVNFLNFHDFHVHFDTLLINTNYAF